MAFNVGMDEGKSMRGFAGRNSTSVKVTNNPGGNSSLNLFSTDVPGETHHVSQCQKERNKSSIFDDPEEDEEYTRARLPSAAQLERNKSVVFEDQDHETVQRRSSIKMTGPPERQSIMETSNFYDTANYRPKTKIQNPPGGASSVTFG